MTHLSFNTFALVARIALWLVKCERFGHQLLALMSPCTILATWRKWLAAKDHRELFLLDLKVEAGFALWIAAITATYEVFHLPLYGLNFLETLISKVFIGIVVVAFVCLLGYLPTLWVNMIAAVPKTMTYFQFVYILVKKFATLVANVDLEKRFITIQRIVVSRTWSWSTLFPRASFPYSLFPIKYYLLIPG